MAIDDEKNTNFSLQVIELSYNCRFMQFTSSATRSCCTNTQIFSITLKTFSKFLALVAQWTWNISSCITMEAILLSIHLVLFLLGQILIILLLMTEKGFLHRWLFCIIIRFFENFPVSSKWIALLKKWRNNDALLKNVISK